MGSIFDGHCDVLYRMWKLNQRNLFFKSTNHLHSSFERLKNGKIKVQTMAIFVPPETPREQRHYAAFEMVDILYHHILEHNEGTQTKIKLLKDRTQLEQIKQGEDVLYILLHIEGAEPLHGDLTYLRTFYQLGVRSLGFTWNYRNEAADGVKEPHPAGLSQFGFELLAEMNRLRMAVDISHISEYGFWDCIEHSTQPIMASHCNARRLCDHPRNLYDDQIEAIFKMKGLIGINFVPFFLTTKNEATSLDVLRHLDYMLSLGGEDFIGFGSDFDGTQEMAIGLEHSGKMNEFLELCLQHYSEKVVRKIFFDNWRRYYLELWAD